MNQMKFTRRRFALLAGSVALPGMAGCSESGAAESGPTTEQPESEDAPTVKMITDNQGSYFDPKGLLVEPGTTVRFENTSGSHTATAYHPETSDGPRRIPSGAEPWASGMYTEPGKTFEVTLETPGVYDYLCKPHEMLGMVGRIVVGESRGGPATTAPTELPPGAREAFPTVEAIVTEESVPGP